jgi:cytochrome c-type biogenesis protein
MILLVIGILMLFNFSFNFKSLSVKNKEGIIGSFVLGFLTSIAWAPCYSAYLISLISLLVSSSDVGYAVFNIILYVLGFALTLFVLSYFISKISIEKLISKTKYLPKIFAILIIVGAVYLFFSSFQILI